MKPIIAIFLLSFIACHKDNPNSSTHPPVPYVIPTAQGYTQSFSWNNYKPVDTGTFTYTFPPWTNTSEKIHGVMFRVGFDSAYYDPGIEIFAVTTNWIDSTGEKFSLMGGQLVVKSYTSQDIANGTITLSFHTKYRLDHQSFLIDTNGANNMLLTVRYF